MSIKKEVFLGKVLQKLYPAPAQLKLQTVVYPPSAEVESVANQTCVIAKSIKPVIGNGDGGIPALKSKKLYTVLPPPEGYSGGAQLPVVGPAPESTSKGSDPESEEPDDVQEEEPRRKRRRRRKGKVSEVLVNGAEGKESVTGSEVDAARTSPAEQLSRNKKRKLKKKRHREKLRSLGLAPQASVVEFTYQHKEDAEAGEDEAEDEEDECNDEQAAEVLDFLQTTLETYISDRSSPERTPPSGVDALLRSLSDRTAPPGELARLCGLKKLVLRRDTEELRRLLEDFQSSTAMPVEEASAVCTLFHYWIADIFPLGEVLKT